MKATSEPSARPAFKVLVSCVQYVVEWVFGGGQLSSAAADTCVCLLQALQRFVRALTAQYHPSHHPYSSELGAVRTLLQRLTQLPVSAGSSSSLNATIEKAAFAVLAEGFEWFYDTWKERVQVLSGNTCSAVLQQLIGDKYIEFCNGLRSSSALVWAGRDLNYVVRCPTNPKHPLQFYGLGKGPVRYGGVSYNCDVCSARAQPFSVGWYHCDVCGNLDVCPACYPALAARASAAAAPSALSRAVIEQVMALLQRSLEHDKQWLAQDKPAPMHWATAFVSMFLVHLQAVVQYG